MQIELTPRPKPGNSWRLARGGNAAWIRSLNTSIARLNAIKEKQKAMAIQQPTGAQQAESYGLSTPPRQSESQNAAAEQWDVCRQEVASFVKDRPFTAVLTLFGVGLGAGLLAAQMLAPAPQRSRSQQISDRISRAVKDALPTHLWS